ncbi:RTA1-domain-containing protein [Dentipellis sp. KUC8613]|nr:RTA1-domain-containing protein [Dentipellis sp. KUC8613]
MVTVRADAPAHVADPFADPKNDPYNILHYIPSNPLTLTSHLLFEAVAVVHLVCMWRSRSWWMSVLVIGELTMSFGLICRWPLHLDPDSRIWYILQSLFTVLSPCAFIAADYMILGRLVRSLDCEQHLRLVPPRRITTVFITSDILTFLIQASGGGLAAQATSNSAQLGSRIFLGGLIIQLLSFLLFTAIFLIFVYRVRKYEPRIWSRDSSKHWYWDWRTFTVAISVNCVGIIIRSIYRTVEMSQGFSGPLSTTEGYFYGLDTLPLFIAVVVYIPFWPGRFIHAPPKPKSADEEQRENLELMGRSDWSGGGRSMHDSSSGDRVLVT